MEDRFGDNVRAPHAPHILRKDRIEQPDEDFISNEHELNHEN